MPQADIALAVFGTMMVEQPSSCAIGTMLSPAAPPPATITLSRGLRPSLTVISWIALIISSFAMVMIANAVSRGRAADLLRERRDHALAPRQGRASCARR